jgi:hypothetical protein
MLPLGHMKNTILSLAGVLVLAGLVHAQPDGRMAPGSGSGTSPGTGATAPDYEDTQTPKSHGGPDSGSTGREGEEPRGSIGSGAVEPGGSGAGTTTKTTVAPYRRY